MGLHLLEDEFYIADTVTNLLVKHVVVKDEHGVGYVHDDWFIPARGSHGYM